MLAAIAGSGSVGSDPFLLDLLTGHEPLRSADFSPQGRPQAGAGSCGLKSALLRRFMGRSTSPGFRGCILHRVSLSVAPRFLSNQHTDLHPMKRRDFLALSGSASGLLTVGALSAAAAEPAASRQYLALHKYTFASPEQRAAFDGFMKEAAMPAFARLGIGPVGVFEDLKEPSPVFVLLPHPTAESALTYEHKLLADAEFTAKGAAFIEAPKAALPFQEVERWLLLAFKGMPKVETPVKAPGRVFQLRIYESPSLKTGQKKIEMFNDAGEIRIFREVGLAPVFFGEALYGAKMPNLTYMLAFENEAALKAAWGRFGQHPDWQKLRAMPEFADNKILRNIVNLPLKAAEYSQI